MGGIFGDVPSHRYMSGIVLKIEKCANLFLSGLQNRLTGSLFADQSLSK
jgi:hypothetical protein